MLGRKLIVVCPTQTSNFHDYICRVRSRDSEIGVHYLIPDHCVLGDFIDNMPESPYRSGALYDYRQPDLPTKSSKIYLWNDWCLGICRPAATADDKAIPRDPALEPVRGPHRIAPAEAIKIVQQCLKTLQHNTQDQKHPSPIAPMDKLTYPFDVFDHIDQALFSGILKGNVFLRWEFLQRDKGGRTSRAGFAASPRISIGLSDNLRRGPPSSILEALVHQMLHAYLLQCCGYREPNAEMNGHDLAHDLEYSTLAYLIKKFLLDQKIPRCPACLGHHVDTCPSVRRRSAIKRLTDSYMTEPGSSHCEAKTGNITLKSIQDYNQHVKKTTPVPFLKIQDRSPVDSNKVPRYAICFVIIIFELSCWTAFSLTFDHITAALQYTHLHCTFSS